MIINMDSRGRIVIPKPLREQAGIYPGMPLEVRLGEDCIEIEPEENGEFAGATRQDEDEPLTLELCNEILRKIRFREDSP